MTSTSAGSHSAVPDDSASLPSGHGMPLLGFGTWQLKGEQAQEATLWALEAGYRHIDTATMYGNEKDIGAALAESGVSRDEVFITTKLGPDRVGHELDTLKESLDLLGVDQVDLWLIHWPPDQGGGDMWTAFTDARQQGLARDIGVSNYTAQQMDDVAKATGVVPAVNQIRWSPLLYDALVIAQHNERDIVLEGYSGLKGGTLEEPVIGRIADRLARTPAQVIIRWHLQHGIVVIPKSGSQQRIAQNAEVADFSLTEEDMTAIDALGPASGGSR